MSDEATGGNSYVLFRVGDERYGLPVSSVVSIIRYKAPTPVPRAPETVLGVVNLRGRVVPVVDLALRFSGRAFDPTPGSRIVVVECARGILGIAVDMASEVATFASESIKPLPESALAPETAHAFFGVAERSDGLVVLLDPEETMPRYDISTLATETPGEREEEGTDA